MTMSPVEQGLQELIDSVERERGHLERLLRECDSKLEMYNRTLADWRAMAGKSYSKPESPASVETYPDLRNLSMREMLIRWATTHGGIVRMRDLVEFTTDQGFFQTAQQAAGSLYPSMRRAGERFDKVGPGVYRLRDGESEATGPKPNESQTEETKPPLLYPLQRQIG